MVKRGIVFRVALAGACTILVYAAGVARTDPSLLASTVDEWFDSYGDISWEDEKAHLDNFVIALQNDLGRTGYIIVYAGRRSCENQSKDRALRAKKYLVETRGIPARRIKWIDGGYREDQTVILQPVPRDSPKLKASPTLKRSEVQIIKNCKSKSWQLTIEVVEAHFAKATTFVQSAIGIF